MNNKSDSNTFTKETLLQAYDKIREIKKPQTAKELFGESANMKDYPYGPLSLISGIQIIESDQMVERKETEVLRTWKERLFSFPWKPLKKSKTVVTYIPKQEILQYGNMIVCHPAVAARIRKELSKIN